MTSRILKLIIPVDLITPKTLETIRKVTESTKVSVEYHNTVVVDFGYGVSLNKLNTFAIKISKEVCCELYSITQNHYNCTVIFA